MSEQSNIARPYAQAVFELAKESQRFDEWSQQLRLLTELAAHPDFDTLIGDPRVTREQILEVILEITYGKLDEPGQNFIKILSHYRRLAILPLIAQQYETLRAENEGIVEAKLETAYALNFEQEARLVSALQQRLGRRVRLTSQINHELIGGAVIRAGDWVIDGSVRTQINKLASSLGV